MKTDKYLWPLIILVFFLGYIAGFDNKKFKKELKIYDILIIECDSLRYATPNDLLKSGYVLQYFDDGKNYEFITVK